MMDGGGVWVDGSLAYHKPSKRWHTVLRCNGEISISEQSFATREEAFDRLKVWVEANALEWVPMQ
jgi:hypothetical protein